MLPASPSVSCPRILVENNPGLHHLSHLLGCQQTILQYSNHAAWAAIALPLAQNTMDGVWNLRLSGCGVAGQERKEKESDSPVILTEAGRRLGFSDKLRRIWQPREVNICSLKELCLKVVYSLLPGRLVMTIKVTEDVHLHLPSVSVASTGLLALSDLLLPPSITSVLSSGPASHCCSPSCCRPIFQVVNIIKCISIRHRIVVCSSSSSLRPCQQCYSTYF